MIINISFPTNARKNTNWFLEYEIDSDPEADFIVTLDLSRLYSTPSLTYMRFLCSISIPILGAKLITTPLSYLVIRVSGSVLVAGIE